MKRCNTCQHLADNGAVNCTQCGSRFAYDPKISPFSETKLLAIMLMLVAVAVVGLKLMPLKPLDPTVCSRQNLTTFRTIVKRSHDDLMGILAETTITSKQLSEVMQLRRQAEDLEVPECLETARQYYVDYLKTMYYTTTRASWIAFDTLAAEQAYQQVKDLQAEMDRVGRCLPDCSTP